MPASQSVIADASDTRRDSCKDGRLVALEKWREVLCNKRREHGVDLEEPHEGRARQRPDRLLGTQAILMPHSRGDQDQPRLSELGDRPRETLELRLIHQIRREEYGAAGWGPV